MKSLRLIGFILASASTLILSSCGGSSGSAEDLAKMYADAVVDAQDPTAAKISTGLTAITADEPGLVWEGEAGASRLLMITNMSRTAFENFGYKAALESGDDYTLFIGALAWVTAVPEAIDYFKGLGYPAAGVTELRYAQALGLPEPTEERMIVGLLVDPADLFRPCPDPEVNDHECELDYPTNHSGGLLIFDPAELIFESAACSTDGCTYEQWFENRRQTAYTGDNPFPWTQLGYTYDWATDAPPMSVGLSEFAVKGGSVFKVVSAAATEEYFLENWDSY